MNNKGQTGIIEAIIAASLMIIVLLFIIVACGTFLDIWMSNMIPLMVGINPVFADTVSTVFKFVSMFWAVCGLFMLVAVIYIFKYIIKKHTYTRFEEEEEL